MRLMALISLAGALYGQALTATIDQAVIKILPFQTSVTFSLGNGTPGPSGVAVLDLSAASSRRPAGVLGFDLAAPAGIDVSVLPGPALPSGLVPSCTAPTPTTRRCAIISQGGVIEFGSGVVARLAVNTTGAVLPVTITISNVSAGLPTGEALQAAIVKGTGTIGTVPPGSIQVLTATCITPPYDAGAGLPPGTWRLEPGETLRCTVTLSGAAPLGGYTAAVTADQRLKVSAIVVAAGQTVSDFTISLQ